MAEVSFPNSAYNAGAVTEAEYERVAARWADDGLYGSPADPAPVVAGNGLEVVVRAGLVGNLRGFGWTSGSTDVVHPLAANSSGSDRIDRLVWRLDRSTWQVRTAILQGTPGGGYPLLTRDSWDTGVYEEPMAEVLVPNGATSVAPVLRPLYVGSRVRVADSNKRQLPTPPLGGITHEPDTGRWTGFDGSEHRVLHEDTGWATLAKNGRDAIAWDVDTPFRYRRINQVVFFHMEVSRWPDNPLRLSDDNGSTPYVLPAGFRPGFLTLGHGNHARNALQLFVYPNGEVRIYPMNEDLAAGRRIYAGASFPVG